MSRLNSKASNILKQEIELVTKGNSAGDVQREIVLSRLEKLSSEEGEKLTALDISSNILDIIPDFPEEIIKKAAKANQKMNPAKKWGLGLGIVGLGIAGIRDLQSKEIPFKLK